jgi:hypothetical protein
MSILGASRLPDHFGCVVFGSRIPIEKIAVIAAGGQSLISGAPWFQN